MASPIAVYIETGSKRVFAGALDWPGWCRSAKTEHEAIEALDAYRSRYRAAIEPIKLPAAGRLTVVQHVRGDATTDFGAPSTAPEGDGDHLTRPQLKRQIDVLRACWSAFDAAAATAARATLATGPRGGGRQVEQIVDHVFEADRAYVSKLGHPFKARPGVIATRMDAIRDAFVAATQARNDGEPDRRSRATTPMWPARYAIRRSAWHALDHAWEIEDRSS